MAVPELLIDPISVLPPPRLPSRVSVPLTSTNGYEVGPLLYCPVRVPGSLMAPAPLEFPLKVPRSVMVPLLYSKAWLTSPAVVAVPTILPALLMPVGET